MLPLFFTSPLYIFFLRDVGKYTRHTIHIHQFTLFLSSLSAHRARFERVRVSFICRGLPFHSSTSALARFIISLLFTFLLNLTYLTAVHTIIYSLFSPPFSPEKHSPLAPGGPAFAVRYGGKGDCGVLTDPPWILVYLSSLVERKGSPTNLALPSRLFLLLSFAFSLFLYSTLTTFYRRIYTQHHKRIGAERARVRVR